MAKAFTDIEQSKKLAKILPPESADMYYHYTTSVVKSYYEDVPKYVQIFNHFAFFHQDIPCWSLAALLELMPKLYDEGDLNDDGCQPILCKGFDNNMWHVVYRETIYGTDWYCEPIDAAFDMVCWLLENKKI